MNGEILKGVNSGKKNEILKADIIVKALLIFVAVNLIGMAVALILESELGCEPIGLLCDGIAHFLSISFGNGSFIYNVLTIVLALVTAKKNLGMGTVAYGLLSGFFIDFYRNMLTGLELGDRGVLTAIVIFSVGEIMMAAAFALLIQLHLGMTALDAILVKLEEILHVSYSFLKIGMDICFVVAGYLLGGTFGAGTVGSALITGILVKRWAKIFELVNKNIIRRRQTCVKSTEESF